MRQSLLAFGVTVLTLGILSGIPGINVMGAAAAPGEGVTISLPLETTQNFSLGAVTHYRMDLPSSAAGKMASPV